MPKFKNHHERRGVKKKSVVLEGLTEDDIKEVIDEVKVEQLEHDIKPEEEEQFFDEERLDKQIEAGEIVPVEIPKEAKEVIKRKTKKKSRKKAKTIKEKDNG